MVAVSAVSLAATSPRHATGHQDRHQNTGATGPISRFDRAVWGPGQEGSGRGVSATKSPKEQPPAIGQGAEGF
jgi:hypothetical protein